MKKEKCQCLEILNRSTYPPLSTKKIYIHLLGCPEDFSTKEYDLLPWWKKIYKTNPRKFYLEHFFYD